MLQQSTGEQIEGVVDKLAEKFVELATTLEGPAKHTYELFVRQAQIEGMSEIVTFTAAVTIAAAASYKAGRKLQSIQDTHSGEHTVYEVFQWVSGIAAGAITVAFVCRAGSWMTKILNPEYYAIREITRMVW